MGTDFVCRGIVRVWLSPLVHKIVVPADVVAVEALSWRNSEYICGKLVPATYLIYVWVSLS